MDDDSNAPPPSSPRRPPARGPLAPLKDFVVRKALAFTGSQRFLSAQLDITNACNLSCLHCYHADHSNRDALDFPSWLAVLDQYARLADKLYLSPRFVLCGGEPTVSPLFWPMIEELGRRWPAAEVAVLTNATRLDPGFVARLRGRRVVFQISLDGPDAARHDAIRGGGNFAQALAGLRNLQDAGMNAAFLATLSLKTSAWIPEFFDTAARVGAERMSFTRFISQGSGRLLEDRSEDRPLRPRELERAYRTILAESRARRVGTNTDAPLYRLIDPALGAHGKVGFQGLVIDYQGNLKVTSRTGAKLGKILDEGLENLFLRHPTMNALRDRRVEVCGSCEHYENCGGDRSAAYAETGSFLAQDPGCWLEEDDKSRDGRNS